MPLSKKVLIGEGGIHGNCWFAADDIKAGEWLWKAREVGAPHTDMFLSRSVIDSWPSEKREKWYSLAYQVNDDLYCGFDPDKEPIKDELVEDYINHSCSGNSWYLTDQLLVAARDITKGEEINYDYALTEADPLFNLNKCLCGTKICRGAITGNDWKLPHLQSKYKGHFLSYINRKIENLTKSSNDQKSNTSSTTPSK